MTTQTLLQGGSRFLKRMARRVVDESRRFHDPYGRWLRRHIAERQARLAVHAAPGQFSLLTSVYEHMPAPLFAATADAVFAQSSPEFEWVVLAHGPIPTELEQVLDRIARDPRVRLLRKELNVGIIGGARLCLEAATGAYVVPLDADDLLTPDALQILAQGIHDLAAQKPGFFKKPGFSPPDYRERPEFIYTDEDFLVHGRPRSPFHRPDWDPVLNLASSFVWHLCAFRRTRALELGVYSDPASNWCHDWDTLFRFSNAGITPVHLPEIVYHWRTHAASYTNQNTPHAGSLDSQKHVLERQIARQPRPHLYEVQPFPIFRGAPDWMIERRHIEPAAIDVLHVDHDLPALQAAVSRVAGEYTVVCGPGVNPLGDAWTWEAMRLFEFHPDVALIAGRILDRHDRVVGAGEILSPLPGEGFNATSPLPLDGGGVGGGGEGGHDGTQSHTARRSPETLAPPTRPSSTRGEGECSYSCLEIGARADQPGPFSLWLKARCVDAVNPSFFVARTAFLKQALARLGSSVSFELLGRELGTLAAGDGLRVTTSPLIQARADNAVHRPHASFSPGPAGRAL